MILRTRHFGFMLCRQWTGWRWFERALRIGFVHAREYDHDTYRYQIGIDFWLIPNFIFYQHYIPQDPRVSPYHTQIIGIQNWPFRFWTRRVP